jgi:hypothetical protein
VADGGLDHGLELAEVGELDLASVKDELALEDDIHG